MSASVGFINVSTYMRVPDSEKIICHPSMLINLHSKNIIPSTRSADLCSAGGSWIQNE